MKRAWIISLMVLGISTSAICADSAKSAAKTAAAQVKDDTQDERGSKVDRRIESMTTDLGLSKSQQESIRKVLEDSHEKNKALRREMSDKHQAIKDDADAKIGALLKPDQKKKFAAAQDAKSEGRRMSKDAGN